MTTARALAPAPATRSVQGPVPLGRVDAPAENAAQLAAAETARLRPASVPWSFADVATSSDETPESVSVPGAGTPIPTTARAEMEERFGEDFSAVRVHAGGEASSAARAVDASAFSVGEHIVLGEGRDVAAPRSRRLVAHELAHVVQARRSPSQVPVARREKTGSTASTAADHGDFVDEASRYLESAASHYRSMASMRKVDQARAPQQSGQGAQPAAARTDPSAAATTGTADRTADRAKQSPAKPASKAGPPVTGLTPDGLKSALTKLESVYESSRTTLEQNLPNDAARAERLRKAYVSAASGARAAAVDQTRVNLVIISAPKADRDGFIANAKTYAGIYYGKGQRGEIVTTITDVDSVAGLFTAIADANPDRLIGRVDIFAHGTIEPVHQMKLGRVWHRIGDFSQEARSRASNAKTLATQSRFDGSTVIELHACRLGADDGMPGQSADPVTHGKDFTQGLSTALGGEQGQTAVAYKQRWVPRRFSLGNINPRRLAGARRAAFVREAISVWDAAMAGGSEAQALMTEAERASGTVTRDRKIAIMEQLYLAGGGAWLIGHQYSGADPVSRDPARDVKTQRDTFSNEADWRSLTLEVKAPAPAVIP